MPRRPCPETKAAADYLTVLGVVLAALPIVLLVDGFRGGHIQFGRTYLAAAFITYGLGILFWPAAMALILAGAGVTRFEPVCRRVAVATLGALAAVLAVLEPAAGLRGVLLRAFAVAAAAGLVLLLRPAVREDFARPPLRLVTAPSRRS